MEGFLRYEFGGLIFGGLIHGGAYFSEFYGNGKCTEELSIKFIKKEP